MRKHTTPSRKVAFNLSQSRLLKQTKYGRVIALGVAMLLGAKAADAQALSVATFDSNPTLAATQTANAWYPDRYRPAGFSSTTFQGQNVLLQQISTADAAASRPGGQQGSFYNTQGRKFDMPADVIVITADLYIPSSWQSAHRRAEIWGTGVSASNSITAYPIIGFANVDGSTPALRYYNSETGLFTNIPGAINYNSWYTFTIKLTGSTVNYYVNNQLVGSYVAPNTASLSNLIVQAYNFGDAALTGGQYALESYDVMWDNVGGLIPRTRYVATSGTDAGNDCAMPGNPCATIQRAITQANSGDSVSVKNGTYYVTSQANQIDIDKSLVIQGQTAGAVYLNFSSLVTSTWPVKLHASNVTLRNFTVVPAVNVGSGFTFHVGGDPANAIISNIKMENIAITSSYRTPFDFSGVDNVSLDNLTVANTSAGNGINLSGVKNAYISNFTTLFNAWGAIGIYPSSGAGRASSNINVDGSTFSAPGSTNNGSIYTQDDATYTSTGINISGWDYKVTNNAFGGAGSNYYTFYAKDLAAASTLGNGLQTAYIPNTASVAQQISTGEYAIINTFTLNAAANKASGGSTIHVYPGTYTLASTVNVNKALHIYGTGVATIQGSNAVTGSNFLLFTGSGSGSEVNGLKFLKTDKTGPQNLLGIQTNNVNIHDCSFQGQYVLGDGDVSRAISLSPSVTGLSFSNNTVSGLRQPGYLDPNSQGTFTNNAVSGTRGWVIDNSNSSFTGNTFSGNAVDIAILASTSASLYTDLFALSNTNNNAFINDQRTSPQIFGSAQAYVNGGTGDDNNDGKLATPYKTIARGVDRVLPTGSVVVAAGSYPESVTIARNMTVKGPNFGIAGTGTRGTEAEITDGKWTLNGAAATVDGFKFTSTSTASNQGAFLVLDGGTPTISNNIINRNAPGSTSSGTQSVRGVEMAGRTSGTLSVANNLFTGSATGIFQNVSWQSGIYANSATGTGLISISGNTFENCRSAINIDDISANHTVSGNTFTTNGTHISFGGTTPPTGSYTMAGNEFSVLPGGTIFNLSNVAPAFVLTATGNTYGGVATASLTDAQKFAAEANMNHRGANGKNGVVNYVPGQQIMIPANPQFNLAIGAASTGNTILAAAGAYPITTTINVNKQVILKGTGTVTVSGSNSVTGSYFMLFSGSGAGAEVDNIDFLKTDKTGVQNLLGIQAANVNVHDCGFQGQYVLGDGDVSRAIELSGSGSNFTFNNNTVAGLRQPGYLNATTATISNSSVTGTRGWVVDNANVSFTNNTFSGNAVDIAILATTSASLYTNLFALSNGNNNAYINDQRSSPQIFGAALSYVNGTTGNDNNNGTAAAPYATVQRGVDRVLPTGTTNVAAGTYNEDVTISKTLTLDGGAASGTIIRGLYSGATNPNTITIAANNVTVKNVTVTRDYGANFAAWSASTKNQGILINQNISGTTIDKIIAVNNRNGIYGQNCPNTTITNSVIEKNRTGLHFGRDFSGSKIQNNFIRSNMTFGLLFNADFGAAVNISNVTVSQNSFTSNWYWDMVYQNNSGVTVSAGDATGFNGNCNWFNTLTPTVKASATNPPAYATQVPVAFGGTPPASTPNESNIGGVNVELLLNGINSFLNAGTDIGTEADGFQPAGSCITRPSLIPADCGRMTFYPGTGVATATTDPSYSQWHFRINGTTVITRNVNTLNLNNASLTSLLATYGDMVKVEVEAKVGATWTGYGHACYIGIISQDAIPKTKLTTADCGNTELQTNDVIHADDLYGASRFEYTIARVGDPGSAITFAEQSSANFSFNNTANKLILTGSPLFWRGPGDQLVVTVRMKINGLWGNAGDPCTIGFILPRLQTADCNRGGYTRTTNATNLITSVQVVGATTYYFKFTNIATSAVHNATVSARTLRLNNAAITPALLDNTAYKVEIACDNLQSGTSPYGTACNIGIGTATVRTAQGSIISQEEATEDIVIFPNPANEVLNLEMNLKGSGKVLIMDLAGKTVRQQSISGEGFLHQTIDISGISAGTYLINVIDDKGTQSVKRFIKQ